MKSKAIDIDPLDSNTFTKITYICKSCKYPVEHVKELVLKNTLDEENHINYCPMCKAPYLVYNFLHEQERLKR